MPDPKDPKHPTPTDEPQNQTPAGGDPKPEPKEEKPAEKSVPYDRFKQINDERNTLKAQVEEFERQRRAAEEEEQRQRGELDALVTKLQKERDELTQERDRLKAEVEGFRARAQEAIEKRLKALPEKLRALAPETGDLAALGAWLDKAAPLAEEAGSAKPGVPRSPSPAAPKGSGATDEDALRAHMQLYRL